MTATPATQPAAPEAEAEDLSPVEEVVAAFRVGRLRRDQAFGRLAGLGLSPPSAAELLRCE